jgi:hypothetical protein
LGFAIHPEVAGDLLNVASTPGSLDEIAARASHASAEGSHEAIVVAQQLAEAGFLAEPSTRPIPSSPAAAAPTGSLQTLGVLTRNRPELLVRAVRGYVDHARRFGRNLHVIVADDSDPDGTARNAEALRAVAQDYPSAKILHSDPEQRSRYVHALARAADVDESIVEFAVLREDPDTATFGAHRNTLLLATVGERVLFADDDTVCAPAGDAGIDSQRISGVTDPTEFHFFDERDAALDFGATLNADCFALHEAYLGHDVVSFLARSHACEIGTWTADLTRALESPSRRPIALTLPGIRGDSGMGRPAYLYTLAGPSRERFVIGDTSHRRFLCGRHVVRRVPRTVIGTCSLCMAALLGVDNRQLLPPFAPTLRNEDGLFGALLRSAVPSALAAYLPWTLAHDPTQGVVPTLANVHETSVKPRANDLVGLMIASLGPLPTGDDGEAAYGVIARYLRGWGRASPRDFHEHVRTGWVRKRVAFLGTLERARHAFPHAPAAWKADAMRFGNLVEAELASQDPAPADCRDAAAFRRYVGRLGELLEVWPTLVRTARTLQEQGVSPARELGL